MPKLVRDEYPKLWHYTTAEGLKGILLSQQLWATNILYLNDKEEYTGFFDRKLHKLIFEGLNNGIEELNKTAQGKQHLNVKGGASYILNTLYDVLYKAIRTATLKWSAYVTSFCIPTLDNGLLSQWRGYGTDGGYAVEFDTKELLKLIDVEYKTYHYDFFHVGDVDYQLDDAEQGTVHKEATQWENEIREIFSRYVQECEGIYLNEELGHKLYKPLLSLATRHKHHGFAEEKEVRIIAVNRDINRPEAASHNSGEKLNKPINFLDKNGVLIPYISLLETPAGGTVKLPISKIVIGPHPDKDKRKMSVEMLLSKLGISAPVIISDIPFVGR